MTGDPDLDDKEWIRAAVARFEGPLTLYAARLLGDADRARDVVQDTFLKLCRQDAREIRDRLAEWLFTVCRNRALDVLRKEGRMTRLSDEHAGACASADPSPCRGARDARIGGAGLEGAGEPPAQPARGDPPEIPERLLLPGDQPHQRPQRLERRVPDPHGTEDDPPPPGRRPPHPRPGLNHPQRTEIPPMPIDPEDPRLTAYALGELEDDEKADLERLLSDSDEARRAVEEVRETARLLAETLAEEVAPGLSPTNWKTIERRAPASRSPSPSDRNRPGPWRKWAGYGIAASLLVGFGASAGWLAHDVRKAPPAREIAMGPAPKSSPTLPPRALPAPIVVPESDAKPREDENWAMRAQPAPAADDKAGLADGLNLRAPAQPQKPALNQLAEAAPAPGASSQPDGERRVLPRAPSSKDAVAEQLSDSISVPGIRREPELAKQAGVAGGIPAPPARSMAPPAAEPNRSESLAFGPGSQKLTAGRTAQDARTGLAAGKPGGQAGNKPGDPAAEPGSSMPAPGAGPTAPASAAALGTNPAAGKPGDQAGNKPGDPAAKPGSSMAAAGAAPAAPASATAFGMNTSDQYSARGRGASKGADQQPGRPEGATRGSNLANEGMGRMGGGMGGMGGGMGGMGGGGMGGMGGGGRGDMNQGQVMPRSRTQGGRGAQSRGFGDQEALDRAAADVARRGPSTLTPPPLARS